MATITTNTIVKGETSPNCVDSLLTDDGTILTYAGAIAKINNVQPGRTTTATAAGTTTLTVSSTYQQTFTGTTTQNCTLPVTSTLTVGHPFRISNYSTGLVTILSSGGDTVALVPCGVTVIVVCNATSGTSGSSWDVAVNGTPTQVAGSGTVARGANSVAIGTTCTANGSNSFASGTSCRVGYTARSCTISGTTVTIAGVNATAEFANSDTVALTDANGQNAVTRTISSVAFGSGNTTFTISSGVSFASGLVSSNTKGINGTARGSGCVATGINAHAEGASCTASGESSHAEGSGCTASEQYCHAEGINTLASTQAAHAEGISTRATGLRSHAEGSESVSAATHSHAEGDNSKARLWGQHAAASGKFAQVGDAQFSRYNVRNATSDATPAILYLDGAGATLRVTMVAKSSWHFTAKVAAYNDTDALAGAWEIRGCIRRDGANGTAIVGTNTTETYTEGGMSACVVTVTADDTNEALQVNVTGIAAKSIRWHAAILTSEVSFGTP
jgi:hypothetical protein